MTSDVYRVADYIADFFADKGVGTVYSLPGGGAMHLIDAFEKNAQLRQLSFFHEQGASIAAESAARTAGNEVGVCCVTTGPGATNAITAVAGAWIESSPLVVVSGQVKRGDMLKGRKLRQTGVQEVQITEIIKPVTKFNCLIEDTDAVPELLEKAYQAAISGRKGPVWIDVPLDIQGAPMSKPATRNTKIDSKNTCPPIPLDVVVDLIKSSKRPVFFWGNGVKLDNASRSANSFINEFGFPSLFTWNASDILEYQNSFNFGRPGVVAQRHPNFILQKADLIVSIGSSLDNVITAYNPKNFGKSAFKIIVNIDTEQLDHSALEPAMEIEASAAEFIGQLTLALRHIDYAFDGKAWLGECQKLKTRFENDFPTVKESDDRISHKDFVLKISDVLGEDQLIATGSSGLAIEAFYMMFRNKRGQKYFLTSGLGAMGYGLPSSIGIAAENKDQTVILIESDGSLAMNVQEMQTVVNNELPIGIVLMNNCGYASIRNTQKNYFSERYFGTGTEAGQTMPEWQAVSESYGFQYVCVNELSKLAPAIASFQRSGKPTVFDVLLTRNEMLAPKCSAMPQPDGSILSMPLEDMSPLLPMDVMTEIMGQDIDRLSQKARESG
ncbi:MAG: hypothetical protein CBB97_02210 [Candidatus Endolissoclinum sp. TMED37]|nr:MAG: hypothetical protein CBB97_02210 [Candidatus Endolissoclinum sp. TMED37]